jgi:hypothetical protein
MVLAACAIGTPPPPPPFGPVATGELAMLLPFLQDGVTTRAELLARLGPPDGEFSAGATWIYTFVGTEAGSLRQWQAPGRRGAAPLPPGRERPPEPDAPPIAGWRADPARPDRPFELVVSFGADDRVTRHTLVGKPGLTAAGQ